MKVKFYYHGKIVTGTLVNCETGDRWDDVNYFVLLPKKEQSDQKFVIRTNQSNVVYVGK